MKKTIALILTFVMLVTVVSAFPFMSSATVVTGDCGADAHWTYDTETKTLTIYGTGSTADYLGPDPSVPEFYYRAKPWESYIGEIETVVVNPGITRLGDAVLMEYPALTSVSLPSTLAELGKNNILNCNVLTALTLPEGLEVIGASSVSGCYHLGEIYIPASLREVHWCALMYLNNLVNDPSEQNDLNIYYGGTEEQWNATDFCDADYFVDPDYPLINWTRLWLFSGNYINLIMHYNWTPGPPAPPYKRGDANGDNVVNMKDITILKKYIANSIPASDLVYDNGDVDGNGVINVKDLTEIKKIVANNS